MAVSRRTRKKRARISVGKKGGTAQKRRARRLVADMVRKDPAIRSVSISLYSASTIRKIAKDNRAGRRKAYSGMSRRARRRYNRG